MQPSITAKGRGESTDYDIHGIMAPESHSTTPAGVLAMRFKNLESYRIGGVGNDMQLGIPLPKTPDGRVYRYSPNENAHPRHFLLGDRIEGFSTPDALTPR